MTQHAQKRATMDMSQYRAEFHEMTKDLPVMAMMSRAGLFMPASDVVAAIVYPDGIPYKVSALAAFMRPGPNCQVEYL